MAVLVPISIFLQELEAALKRKDGYIMGAYGQNPKTGSLDLSVTKVSSSWKTSGYYYTQYNSGYTTAQKNKALYWREHATRVWDCNGLAEGIYQLQTGVNINSKARYNYQQWCEPKGTGLIPADRRIPGAAVFWGDSASSITHVGYLYKPVEEGNLRGDWYIIEARGVAYGVVQTKLSNRKPKYWGYMTKYYDYSEIIASIPPKNTIEQGDKGAEVKQLQQALLLAGETLPKYGADGDFGSETLKAVKSFQTKHGLPVTGIVDEITKNTLFNSPVVEPEPPVTTVIILKKGSKGTAVKELQKRLLALSYKLPKYGADGDFGSETETAIKTFQKDAGIPITGQYDTPTQAALALAEQEAAEPNIEIPDIKPITTEKHSYHGLIVDISDNQGKIDMAKLVTAVDYVIARSNMGVTKDKQYKTYAADMDKNNLPYGCYLFSQANTPEEAKAEVDLMLEMSQGTNPTMYVFDIESSKKVTVTTEQRRMAIKEAVAYLRTKTNKFIGLYTGENRFKNDLYRIKDIFDILWIANWGKNDGTVSKIPTTACALHQYTSMGANIPGIPGRVDLDRENQEGTLEKLTGRIYNRPIPAKTVSIVNGNCNIRTGPATTYSSIGVAHKGDKYTYANDTQNGWNTIIYKDKVYWVSGKYSVVN